MRKLLLSSIISTCTIAAQAHNHASPEGNRSLFMPIASYYTGPYSVNGTPFANGYLDYMTYVNQTGGIGGAAIEIGRCETGYNTKKVVECYQSLKPRAPLSFIPLSTGGSYALAKQAEEDRIPIVINGYGIPGAFDGTQFGYSFPVYGDYFSGTATKIQYLAKKLGGYDKLKGLKIAYLVHKSIYGTGTKPLITELAKKYGFTVEYVLVPHPGKDQKEAWKNIDAINPDYIFFRGWGMMNKSMLMHANKHKFPLDKIIGVWWSANTVDVEDLGMEAKGYTGLSILPSMEDNLPILDAIKHRVYDLNQGHGVSFEKNIRSTLYREGIAQAALIVEAARTAQKNTGHTFLTSEEMAKEGFEKLNITQERIKELGLEGILVPVQLTCKEHGMDSPVSVIQWDGTHWKTLETFQDNPNEAAILAKIRKEEGQKTREMLKIQDPKRCQ